VILRRLTCLTIALTATFALVIDTPVKAAAPPMPNKEISMIGRGQKIEDFLRDLFGQAGLKAKISSAVNGTIQGRFTGKPAEIWAQTARAFNLLCFYDGTVVRVYAASEIQSRTFMAAAPHEVVRDARQMNMIDANNLVNAGSGMVTASGIPYFLEYVEKLASRVATKPTLPPVTPTTSNANIVSPIANGSLSGSSDYSAVRSTIIARASTRSPYEVRVFYLRYARADDTIVDNQGRTVVTPGVASVLRGVMGDGRPSETVSTSGNFDIARQSLPRLGGRGFASVAPNASQRDFDDAPAEDVRLAPSAANGPRDVNGPRIEVDPSNNAVLIRDRPESMSVYEDLISSLDTEPRGVEIEATIIELNTNRLRDLGFDFNLNIGGLSSIFGGVAVNPTGSFSSPGISASYLRGNGDAFAARLTALEKNGTARVLSRPRLSTLNNVAAVFDNQIEYFVRVAGDRQVDLFPIKVGMVMRVNPSVVYDGGELRTRLSIEIQDGSTSGLIVDGIPGIQRSSITTNAIIKQGESLLIGGITVENEFDFKSKIPGVGDVPIVGNVFKKRSKGGGRIERLFLITPRIVTQKGGSAMAAVQQEAIPLEVLERGVRKGGKVRKLNGGANR
jgi:type III secretion protein C